VANLTEYQRKYLLRLKLNTIPHREFLRWGRGPISTILSLAGLGYAECIHPDDEGPYCPTVDSPEGDWQITPEGEAAVSR
jgi:hypothetical protein